MSQFQFGNLISIHISSHFLTRVPTNERWRLFVSVLNQIMSHITIGCSLKLDVMNNLGFLCWNWDKVIDIWRRVVYTRVERLWVKCLSWSVLSDWILTNSGDFSKFILVSETAACCISIFCKCWISVTTVTDCAVSWGNSRSWFYAVSIKKLETFCTLDALL